jgi:hypothetical protein
MEQWDSGMMGKTEELFLGFIIVYPIIPLFQHSNIPIIEDDA